jgi:DNA repair ATPase RecN
MKYKPEVDMCILIRSSTNIIGMISNITAQTMTVVRLDECGQVTIPIESEWEPIDVLDPHKLKYLYDTFIGKSVTNIFANNYAQYKNKYSM